MKLLKKRVLDTELFKSSALKNSRPLKDNILQSKAGPALLLLLLH